MPELRTLLANLGVGHAIAREASDGTCGSSFGLAVSLPPIRRCVINWAGHRDIKPNSWGRDGVRI